ncbi:hypothetical protein Q4O66_08560 [Acinetobacter baumannii]|uniref:hypothetical protein n=1 Tax=Acinetobacter calcoaceticus/baumannii complex TaxID=909768 RepID=UPI00056E832A|nr:MULTISPECIES: hypothetical protein [Acinetobacter calcoaceticus/baumannii complex]MBD0439478.1 hypothetical protein [Acinetobacter baumannii]MCJ8979509.1 hypothetical protein [Acinetobacter baumannii]MCJ9372207.1 hypothetical protein [Acinetobacter baumannii]MCJ9473772.1 hypothetical protein [Acinetobacter baumannii]MCJ9477307.1 hypothetical protein [Acinetobacter baumannii]
MINFSQSKQSFYDLNLEYVELPDDLIEINEEQHFDLLQKISSGHYVFSDLTSSDPKPSPYHEMNIKKKKWEDNRTLEQKRIDFLWTLRPLTRRQFKLALLENGLLDLIEQRINAIEDQQMRTRIQIEYTESVYFERKSESVLYMATLLGLNEEQFDEMWIYAMTL